MLSSRASVSSRVSPVDSAEEKDILHPGELGMKSRSEFEQRRDATAHFERAARRIGDARDQPQQRTLAGTVVPNDGETAPHVRLQN
jgi:hypothetical protein